MHIMALSGSDANIAFFLHANDISIDLRVDEPDWFHQLPTVSWVD